MKNEIYGVIPPLVTPFNRDGNLDVESCEKIINHCIEKGVNGIFPMGSCGEGSCVSRVMRFEVVNQTNRIVSGRVPVMAGVLECSTPRVVESIKELEQTGVGYFVVAPPFYIQCTCQDEILRHYETICKNVASSIIVYNIPVMTNANILPQTMVKLSQIDNIVAIKDSTPRWELFQESLLLKEKYGFTLLSGQEDLCGAGLLFGADGVVPALANVFPELYVKLVEEAKTGDAGHVYAIQKKIVELRTAFTMGKSWISILKYICSRQGLISDQVSIPIEPLKPEEKLKIDAVIESYQNN
jgi:dihydrodipicolinate synthase/N-acetylneuraminate lyase